MKTILFTLSLLAFALFLPAQSTQPDAAGKICMEGNFLYIVVPMHGFSIYDVSNTRNPAEIRFVNLPGILDIAVRGDFVYANQNQDLVLVKVPRDKTKQVTELKRSLNVFPSRAENQSGNLPVSFLSFKEYKEDYREYATSAPPASVNGSMSCITLVGNYIYAVEGRALKTLNARPTGIDQSKDWPVTNVLNLPQNDLETIWTDGDNRVYLGSQTGLHIVDVSDRANPNLLGSYRHQRSCDPVVVVGNTAYSTQRNGRDCAGGVNQLDVVDISDPSRPKRIRNYPLTNPHGLAVENDVALVCDGAAGMRIFDAKSPADIRQVGQVANITAYDVLYDSSKQSAFISVPKELHIYSLNQLTNPSRQSVIVLPNMNN